MTYTRIRDLREYNFWTQQYVADKLNVSQRTYSYYESGQRSVPIEILLKLADLYDVSIDYIVGRTDERKPTNSSY